MSICIHPSFPSYVHVHVQVYTFSVQSKKLTHTHTFPTLKKQAAALVGLIVVASFKDAVLHDDPTVLLHVDYMWRLLIGLGCIPACIALYFRLTIPESPRFTMDIERNVQQAASDVEHFLTTSGRFVVDPDIDAIVQAQAQQRRLRRGVSVSAPRATRRDFVTYFSKWENLKVLIGTSWSWFALDVSAFVPHSLFSFPAAASCITAYYAC